MSDKWIGMCEKENFRILAEGKLMSNDTWKTGLNNNDLIIGTSGAGKTRSYVKPNILQCNESIIVADTKGSLYGDTVSILESKGYEVWLLDLTDMENSPIGYNPLAAIRYDEEWDEYNDQDIAMVAAALCPIENFNDPYWDLATRCQMEALIAYVLEALPLEEHNLCSVAKLQGIMHEACFDVLFRELSFVKNGSIAVEKWRLFTNSKEADKHNASIRSILGEKLHLFVSRGAQKLMQNEKQIDFKKMGNQKTALFINVSDVDRAQDKVLNLLYTQALQILIRSADKDYQEHKLQVPVRLILDDFASSALIPHFDKIVSVIRSREIYVSIIIQSLTQLYSMYREAQAQTIINNCDNLLYLGGQDVETAKYIGTKANKSPVTILNMPIGEALLFTRGQEACKVEKYDTRHYEVEAEKFTDFTWDESCPFMGERDRQWKKIV